jgi:hypothetical protein
LDPSSQIITSSAQLQYWHDLGLVTKPNEPSAMTNQKTKRIGHRPHVKEHISAANTLHDTWTVMKPFVHFSVKAMRLLGRALIFLVKNIPKPDSYKPASKKDKVIKT